MGSAHPTLIGIDMNKTFQPLDFDTDVLLFTQDTYTVSKLKELIHENFMQKFYKKINDSHLVVIEIFQSVSINQALFKLEDIKWKSSVEGITCQILRVGSSGWQSGKLRIKISTEIIPRKNHKENDKTKINVVLEFCPDELDQPESPLDDIRQMILAQK